MKTYPMETTWQSRNMPSLIGALAMHSKTGPEVRGQAEVVLAGLDEVEEAAKEAYGKPLNLP